MMGKIANLLGLPSKERDQFGMRQEDYQQSLEEQSLEGLRQQTLQSLRQASQGLNQASQAINPYQQGLNQASQASHGLGQQYHASQTWADPRTENRQVLIGAIEETNKVVRRLSERIGVQERRVEMLTGFYTWVTEVHPEITAQHKAMRELYEAANSGETQTEASS